MYERGAAAPGRTRLTITVLEHGQSQARKSPGARALLLLWILLTMPVSRTAAGAAGPEPIPDEQGAYRVRVPEQGKAWQLPAGDGVHNSCDAGDALSVRWSPDGRYLVAEIDTGERITLCLYDLTAFSFDPDRPKTVIARRLSSSGESTLAGARPGASSSSASDDIYARLARAAGGSRYSFTELEAAWSPVPKRGAPLVFTRRVEGGPERVFGLRSLSAIDRPAIEPMDGRPAASSDSSQFYQPAWMPTGAEEPGDRSAGLSMVSDYGLSGCGRSRIVHLDAPGVAGMTPRVLSSPCGGDGRESMRNAADRYPAWGPGGRRLAFVRVNPGIRNRVCAGERALEGWKMSIDCELVPAEPRPMDRFNPRWTQDGRFLIYFASASTASSSDTRRAPATTSSRIEVIDFQSRDRRPRVLREQVRPGAMQGPALMYGPTGGRAWVLAVVETAEGLPDRIVALPLEARGGEQAREIEVGLRNIKAVDVVAHRSGIRLAIAAQGYRELRGADLGRDKVFILPLPGAGW